MYKLAPLPVSAETQLVKLPALLGFVIVWDVRLLPELEDAVSESALIIERAPPKLPIAAHLGLEFDLEVLFGSGFFADWIGIRVFARVYSVNTALLDFTHNYL